MKRMGGIPVSALEIAVALALLHDALEHRNVILVALEESKNQIKSFRQDPSPTSWVSRTESAPTHSINRQLTPQPPCPRSAIIPLPIAWPVLRGGGTDPESWMDRQEINLAGDGDAVLR